MSNVEQGMSNVAGRDLAIFGGLNPNNVTRRSAFDVFLCPPNMIGAPCHMLFCPSFHYC